MAHWILARELSGRAGASLQPLDEQMRQGRRRKVLTILALLVLAALGILAAFSVMGWKKEKEAFSKKQQEEEKAAVERMRPSSPTNLVFLEQNLGREVVVSGVPRDSDVGYLYFSKDRKAALRVNLFVNGVVLIQSGELEDLVKSGKSVEASGVVVKSADGFYEIRLGSANRLKIFE